MEIDFESIQNNIDEIFNISTSKSLMEIYGVNRLEAAHSEFLTWLFNEYKLVAIIPLLEELSIKRKLELGNVANHIIQGGTSNLCEIRARRECAFKQGSSNDRIDIITTIKTSKQKVMNLFVEVKVESEEHWNKAGNNYQTVVYYNNYSNDEQYKDSENIFIYLTIEGSKAECQHFQPLSYQDLYDWILRPIIQNNNKNNKNNIKVIKDYCKALQAISTNKSKPLIMANIW